MKQMKVSVESLRSFLSARSPELDFPRRAEVVALAMELRARAFGIASIVQDGFQIGSEGVFHREAGCASAARELEEGILAGAADVYADLWSLEEPFLRRIWVQDASPWRLAFFRNAQPELLTENQLDLLARSAAVAEAPQQSAEQRQGVIHDFAL